MAIDSSGFWDVVDYGSAGSTEPETNQHNQHLPIQNVFGTSNEQHNFLIGDAVNYSSSSTSSDAMGRFLAEPNLSHDLSLYKTPPGSHNVEENGKQRPTPRYIGQLGCSELRALPPDRPLSPARLGSNKCNCLQHHAELLCQLRDVGGNPPTMDIILISTHQAIHHWNMLLNCSVCHYTDDQEVLLLSAMSIRAVLRRLKNVCMDYTGTSSGEHSPKAQKPQNEKRQRQDLRLTVGLYQVTAEEQALVTDLLLMHVLRKIRLALASMTEKLGRAMRTGKVMAEVDSSGNTTMSQGISPIDDTDFRHEETGRDSSHVQQLLVEFEGTLQRLERSLTSNSAVIMLNHGNAGSG